VELLLLSKRTILGLALCVLILSASLPLLLGLKASPFKTLYGKDVLTLTQVTTDVPLNTTLIQDLETLTQEKEWVQMVSPEVYVFAVLQDSPTLVRGVNTTAFLSIEDAVLIEGTHNDERSAMIGEGLSNILGINIGDRILITGSTRPSLLEVIVVGTYSTPNPSNDEMIISIPAARKLAGIRDDTVMSIRVKTTNEGELINFLNENEIPVVVSAGTSVPDVLNSNVTYDGRLINLLFEYSDASFSQDLSLTTAFTHQGVSSVNIVVIGFMVLNIGLTFIGISAILTRAITQKKKEIGILSAIGASKGKIRIILLKDILLILLPAILIGIVLGLVLAYFVGAVNLIMVFGHSVRPVIDWVIVLGMAVLVVVVSSIVGIIINERILTSRPSRLIQDTDVEYYEIDKLEDVLS
jgi:ABC-type lipoprotein release transport system permease subunit